MRTTNGGNVSFDWTWTKHGKIYFRAVSIHIHVEFPNLISFPGISDHGKSPHFEGSMMSFIIQMVKLHDLQKK